MGYSSDPILYGKGNGQVAVEVVKLMILVVVVVMEKLRMIAKVVVTGATTDAVTVL